MPGDPIQPFTKNDITGNGMLGAAFNPNEWLTIKNNTATGFRSPNLAELSSNGLHEGVYRYEIGDPNLKTEQNINTDLAIEINREQLFFSASAFYNQFYNYVYLSPTTETFYGFPVFRYKQANAHLAGGEFFMTVQPRRLKGLQWKEGFTLTQGILDNGGYLPFIPAYKLNSSIRFEQKLKKKITSLFIEPEFVYVFKQDKPAQFETQTGSYYLVNLTSGITVAGRNGDWRLGIAGTNLTNQAYMDHLSRLKYYGLYNQGINFVFSARKEIKW